MTSEMYKNILGNNVNGGYAENLSPGWTLQQDNDPKHKSQVVMSWLDENEINVFEWPPQSPDLNPLVNLWGIIKRAVSSRKSINQRSLWDIIQEEWNNITPQRFSQNNAK